MYCRKCGTYMEDDSLFCTACGTKISPYITAAANNRVVAANEEDSINTAEKVGVKVSDIPSQADKAENTRGKKKKNKKILLIGAALALLVLFLLFFLTGNPPEGGIAEFAKWDYTKAEYLEYFENDGTDITDDGDSISHWATGLFGEETLRASCRYYFEEDDDTLSMVRIIALSTHVKDEDKLFDLYVKTLENLIGPPYELLDANDANGPYAKWDTRGVIIEATITSEAVLSEFFEKSYYENGGYQTGFYYKKMKNK